MQAHSCHRHSVNRGLSFVQTNGTKFATSQETGQKMCDGEEMLVTV